MVSVRSMPTVEEAGTTDTMMAGAVTVTVTLAELNLGLKRNSVELEVAVTVTVGGLGGVAGAV